MATVIENGRIIDPARGIDQLGPVAIEDGRVVEVDSIDGAPEVIDATGCWVVPGLIDAHVHLREPGGEAKETIETGLAAAAAGGFTAVMPMPNTTPANDAPALTRMMIQKAVDLGGARVFPVAAATVGRLGRQVGDLSALAAAGAAAFSDDGSAVIDDDVMTAVLQQCHALGKVFSQHAEDPHLSKGAALHDGDVARKLGVSGWPEAAEHQVVARDIALAKRLGCRVHVAHVSAEATIELVRRAKADGVNVTAEVTPHHLMLTDAAAERIGTLAKVNPPLRPQSHVEACVTGLADGTIDIVATDHAPHTAADKGDDFEKAAYGMIGLETAVGLLLELVEAGAISPSRMIEAMSTKPARIFGLPGGTLAPGTVADVTIIDPSRRYTVDPGTFRSKSRNTPFSNRVLPGRAVHTIVAGRTVYALS